MNKIEFVIRCDCGAEIRSPGMTGERLRAVIAAFDASHDPGCFASFPALAGYISDDSGSDDVSNDATEPPDRAQDA